MSTIPRFPSSYAYEVFITSRWRLTLLCVCKVAIGQDVTNVLAYEVSSSFARQTTRSQNRVVICHCNSKRSTPPHANSLCVRPEPAVLLQGTLGHSFPFAMTLSGQLGCNELAPSVRKNTRNCTLTCSPRQLAVPLQMTPPCHKSRMKGHPRRRYPSRYQVCRTTSRQERQQLSCTIRGHFQVWETTIWEWELVLEK